MLSSPVIANGVLYLGVGDGNIYAFDAASGTEQWSSHTGREIYSSPAVVNGTVYVGALTGDVYAFDLAGGTQAAVARPAASRLHPNYRLTRPAS